MRINSLHVYSYLNYDDDGEYGNEWNTESDDSRLDSDDADGGRGT